MSSCMKINIKNLALFASVGCFKHEYEIKTKVLISAVIEYINIDDFSKPENIINYDEILNAINQTVTQQHFAYIEEMACEISRATKKVSSLIKCGSVTVQKCIKGNIVEELSCQISF